MEQAILLRIDPFLWQDESLNYPEKIVLNLIFSFTIRQECCDLTNEWIAGKFGWTPSFVDEVIQLLRVREWIHVHEKWQGARCLSINIPGQPNPCDSFEGIMDVEV
jgi:hypothetical protein